MILITGGCCYSDCISVPRFKTWTQQLSEIINYKHYPTGLTSQGNGLISRKVLYKIETLLEQGIDPSKMLVGIMWTDPTKDDFYLDHKPDVTFQKNDAFENPTMFVPNDPGGWVIMNKHWIDKYSRGFYQIFYNRVWAQIQTYEHVLRTQWYLERKNIKYFMIPFTDRVFNKKFDQYENVSWLSKQIDWSKFPTLRGEYNWLQDNAPHLPLGIDGFHPSEQQHLYYTENVIIPYLKENRLI